MRYRNLARRAGFFAVSLSLAGLAAGCQTMEPPPDLDAPPTEREVALLGPDAMDEYFLTRFRKCIVWEPEQRCRRQPYGDDDGDFH